MAVLSTSATELGPDMIPQLSQVLSMSTLARAGILLVTVSFLRLVYTFLRSIYRVHFHPLAKFSGPREAAISRDWEHKIATEKGAYPEKVFEKLHREYNTRALRIGPNELHLDDVSLYKTIYGQGTKYLKDPGYYDAFNSFQSVFGLYDPQLHRQRRKLLNPMFSRAGMFKLEDLINDKYEIMERKILRLSKGCSIDAYDAFRALTTEIIAQFAFSRSAGLIEESPDDFKCRSVNAIEGTADGVEYMRQYSILRVIAAMLPRRLVARFGGDVGQFMNVLDYADLSVRHWEEHKGEVEHPVIFDALESLSDAQKSIEAMSMIVAGGDTTASTFTYAVAAVTGDPRIQEKLISELETALAARGRKRGDRLPLSELEEIPYLMAVVKESLRCAIAQPARLPRVVPSDGDPLIVDGKVVPPGTVVSMSTYTMNMSEDIFGPDVRTFNPERWLGPDSKQLGEHLYTFSKGSRMCIGINLANAELVILIARLFYNLKVSRPCSFEGLAEREHFTVSYAPRGVHMNFEARYNARAQPACAHVVNCRSNFNAEIVQASLDR